MTTRSQEKMTRVLEASLDRLGPPPAGKSAPTWYRNRREVVVFGRREDGTLYLHHEWYRPEAYGDDDASVTGLRLPHRLGCSRETCEVTAADVEGLREALT